jgi:hypothetical protein
MLESRLMVRSWAFTLGKLPPILHGPPLEIWLQRCYYAGARHVLAQIMEDADMTPGNDLSANDKDKVQAVFDEIDGFFAADVAANEQSPRLTDVQ